MVGDDSTVCSATACSNLTDLFVYGRLDDGQLSSYRDNGYLHLGRVLTDRGLEQLRAESMTAWQKEKDAFDPAKTWLQNSLLSNIHRQSDTARKFYFSGPLVTVAEQIVGPNLKGATSQLTFKMRGNTKPFAWHQDNGYGELDPYNAVSTLTALDDADQGNGCLWLVPTSHRGGQVDVSNQINVEMKQVGESISIDVDESQAVPVPMRAGESLIFHCWMLHKSEGNLSSDRDRRILFLRFADADAVEVYNGRRPRLGRLLRGSTRFVEVQTFEADLPLN